MVSNQWLYHDFPEEKPPNAHQLGDVTCWAKYHVIVPEEDRELSIPYRTHDGMQRNAVIPGEGRPVLLLNPVQFTYIAGDLEAVRKELSEEIDSLRGEYCEKPRIREVSRRLKLIGDSEEGERAPRTSPFRHEDRHLVLGLIGLDIARALGVRDIALPSRELLTEEVGHFYPTLARQMRRGTDRLVFPERYTQMLEFLRQAPKFNVFELGFR
jgi:hypothetical protein